MTDKTDTDTLEFPALSSPTRDLEPEPGWTRVQVDLGALTDKGLLRANNEDHYLVLRFGRALETLLTNLPSGQLPARSEETGYGMLVADGVGGAAAGEVASRLAITTLVRLVLQTPDWMFSAGAREGEVVKERMAERYRQIDAALRDQCNIDPALCGMGTTMTLACSFGESLIIGHIGDSRAYLFRSGKLHQLTRDQTLVQSLLDLGLISAEEAAKHPFRHVLTGSLGAGKESARGEFQRAGLVDEDQLLLCTDGLTEMVDNATIASVLASARSANDACQALVDLALKNGGKDNVTVVLARYRFSR